MDIEVFTPYAPEISTGQADLVINRNVIRRVNPEATAVRERGLRQMSFPARSDRCSSPTSIRWSSWARTARRRRRRSWRTCWCLREERVVPRGGVTLNYDGNYRLGKASTS